MAASDPELRIKSLLVRERYYRDTGQWDKLRDAYHPDARQTHIDITWYQGDIDGFVRGSRGMAQGGTGAIHSICPVEVHLNGDKAVTESTGSISIRFDHNGHQFDCVSLTRFISRLRLVDGVWKLLTLEAIYERDYITPTVPNPNATLTLPLTAGTRDSYRCIGWVLSKKGFTIKQTLPGTDQPNTHDELMARTFAWLNEKAE